MKLAFIIPVYKDFENAKVLIPLIKKFYDNSDIAIMCDGTGNSEINQFCIKNNLKYFNFNHSHNNDTPGGFFRNFLVVADDLNYDLVIKADPDSRILGTIQINNNLKNCVFGTFMNSTLDKKIPYQDRFLNLIRPNFIQNGIFGIGKSVIKKFKKTKYFEDDKYLRERLNFFLSKGQGNPGMYQLSTELLMAIACLDLNLELYNHPDFYSIIYMKPLNIFFYNNIINTDEVEKNFKNKKFIHPIYE